MATARSGGYTAAVKGTGWVAFAGIMLVLVGMFNVIDGLAAIAGSDYLVNQLLFANMDAWGWFFLIWGLLQIVAGFGVLNGSSWGTIVGLVTAFFNAIAQLSWAATYPVWALTAIAIDVLVMYGLVVYGWSRDEA
jgi:hypothetical protein